MKSTGYLIAFAAAAAVFIAWKFGGARILERSSIDVVEDQTAPGSESMALVGVEYPDERRNAGHIVESGPSSVSSERTARETLSSLMASVAPNRLEEYLKVLAELDIDPTAALAPIDSRSWEEAKKDAFQHFDTTPKRLAAWESSLVRELPNADVVDEDYLSTLSVGRIKIEDVSAINVGEIQRIVEEYSPRIREKASEFAIELASARLQIWHEGKYFASPCISLDDNLTTGVAIAKFAGSNDGWCVSYTVCENDFPSVAHLKRDCRALEREMVTLIAQVLSDSR